MRSVYLVICGVRTASSTLLAAGDPKFTLSAQAWSNVHFSSWLLLHSEPRHSLFCMIPKNACSEFLALMMRAHGLSSEHWNPPAHGKHQTLVHYDTAREDMFFGDGDSHVLEGILRNRTWTKSVFLRDPVERFISAYISKVKKINKWFSQTYPSWAGNLPIDRFVSVLESEGLHENTDPHFRPQSYLCGLSQTLSQYDFIGFMSNLEEDADRMGMLMGIQERARWPVRNGVRWHAAERPPGVAPGGRLLDGRRLWSRARRPSRGGRARAGGPAARGPHTCPVPLGLRPAVPGPASDGV